MAFLRIERTPIAFANLGLLGFDHLQLVFQDTVYDPRGVQDDWRVVEGVVDPGNILGTEGGDGVTTLAMANGMRFGDDLIAAIGTPASRGSRILATPDPLGAWSQIAAMAQQIDGQRLPYIAATLPGSALPTINSTSVIASLLFYAGFDIATSWPLGMGFSPGWTTLIGTLGNDNLAITQSFTTLLGGVGDDTLEGSHDSRVDRIYGGVGRDTFRWTEGTNYLHGGQPRLDYAVDGVDTVDYAGAGTVVISANPNYVEHKTPSFTAEHAGGIDYLFSIERLEWAAGSDHIIVKDGAGLLHEGVEMKLGGQASAGHGDTLDFGQQTTGIVANAGSGDTMLISNIVGAGDDLGLWVESAEWLIGSAADDRIWAATGLLGIDGGGGADLIDARAAQAFSGASPSGYDVEIDGGEGDDTLIADAGRTLLHGGAGADRFVLSAMTGGAGSVEIVIDDADAADRILVPYTIFNGSGAGFEGSELMPLLGGLGTYDDMLAGWYSTFQWRLDTDLWYGTDAAVGMVTFNGGIDYDLEGSDLLIRLYLGQSAPSAIGPIMERFPETETIIRVVGFQEGMLGLTFHEFGQESTVIIPGRGAMVSFSNWDTAVRAMTNDGDLEAPLAVRPDAPINPNDARELRDATPPVLGGDGDDTITVSVASRIEAGAGNDSVTGSASADVIDGGTGADSMAGGSGGDSYVVDNVGDLVAETTGGGADRVSASVGYTLSADVEDLYLTGGAIAGTGNGLANRLVGNDVANLLAGDAGDDVVAGEGGDDTLVGGAGRDSYVYAAGDGRDRIEDGATFGETSRLVLTGGIAPDSVTLFRLAQAPDDLVLRFADGGQLTLAGYFSAANLGAVEVAFDDGAGWTAAEFASLAAAAPIVAELTPIAIDDPYLLAARSTLVIPASSLVVNDLSPSGRALVIVAVTSDGGGTVTLRADGDLDYTAPASGGVTTFTYTVSDGVATTTAHGTIGYDPNHAPTAAESLPDATLEAGTAFGLALPVGLFTDADSDTLRLSARLADGSALPSWLVFDAATWTFSGTPPATAAGTTLDVVVTASDGLDTGTAPLRLVIGGAPVNDPPVAGSDAFTVPQGAALTITAAALLANDSDPDGDPLAVLGLDQPAHGTLVASGTGSWLYTPDAGFSGDDALAYTIADDHGHTASGAIAIDVTAIPGATITGNGRANLLTGTAGNDTITGAGGNDTMLGLDGNDVFVVAGQSSGLDLFDGGNGYDLILGSAAADLIGLASTVGNLAGIEVIDGGAGSDTLRGSTGGDRIDLSAIQLIGIELIDGVGGADTIIGSAGADTISGGAGQNALRGGGGDDTLLVAGAAASFYDGGDGFDRLLGGTANDLVELAAGPGNLAGIEAIDGGAGIDTLRGSASNDLLDLSGITLLSIERIDGAGGNDTIVGSAGNDTIVGGKGNDVFVMGAGGGHDTVADFQRGTTRAPLVDVVDVSAWGFASLADVLAHTTTSASGSAVITYDAATSVTLTGIAPTQLRADDFRFA